MAFKEYRFLERETKNEVNECDNERDNITKLSRQDIVIKPHSANILISSIEYDISDTSRIISVFTKTVASDRLGI